MIKNLWPVNVIYEKNVPEISSENIKGLIAIGEEYEKQYPQAQYSIAMRNGREPSYNIFKDPRPEPQLLKNIFKTRMIELAKEEEFADPEGTKFDAQASMRKFYPNGYAKPHVHRSIDYTGVFFAHVGKSFDKSSNCLRLIDPTAMRSRLLSHTMLHEIIPETGTLIIHPAYVFHATELNLTNEPLIAFVVNIRVIEPTRQYEEL